MRVLLSKLNLVRNTFGIQIFISFDNGLQFGSNNNIFLNPASTNHYNGSSIGFSSNRWIQGINGNSMYFSSNSLLLSFTSIGIDDIEIRDEIASEDPIDIV